MNYTITPLGDQAVIIELGKTIDEEVHKRVRRVASFLEETPFDWMTEYIPAFNTVAIFYDPIKVKESSGDEGIRLPFETVKEEVAKAIDLLKDEQESEAREIVIPVCYGGDFGPDLAHVAEHNSLTEEAVIDLHTGGNYLVYMIGFAPGFPYLGGMTEKIATPRKDEPRLEIPAGSVGIAGSQTGVYPIETPGGWQLIGQTPLTLFRPDHETPSLLRAGDTIVFKAISREEFDTYKEDNKW